MPRIRLWVAVAAALSLTAPAARAAAPTLPSAADFTRAPAIESVSISQDGKHLAALSSPDGKNLDLVVWSTDALSAPPMRVRATRMRFIGVRFLKNDRLLVTAVQPLTVYGQAGHILKSYVADLQGKEFDPLLPDRNSTSQTEETYDRIVDATVISTLPKDPRNVLVEDHRLEGRGDIYKVDVYSMSAGRVMKGSEKYGGYQVDLNGELRARQYADFDQGKMFIAQQYRDPKTDQWIELFRSYARDRELPGIVGFTSDPNVVLLSSTNGGDKTGVYDYDVSQKKIIEPAFQHKLFDAVGPLISRSPQDYGQVLGFSYLAESEKVYWIDPRLSAIAESAAKALGVTSADIDWTDPDIGTKASISVDDGVGVEIGPWSDDYKYVLITKSGPKQPPEVYLLTDGTKLALLGQARPWIDRATLGDTKLVEYPARDGLLIPAFLTTPPAGVYGPGPYPTLIEPHGGPWARDLMEWDIAGWVQYFASRGYAVLEPQFRGSEGWGDKLWRAGDAEWGQKMQDDLDDGVTWLIGQRVADPKRVAMFGYSYGGYAALVAAIRPNGLYQCSISGAGAGDLAALEDATFDNRFEREFQHPTIKGLDALEHAREAQIPILLYHGDHDQTVDVTESRKFAAALGGKPHKYVEIKDMGHQYTFMTPDMMEEQLNIVDGFLKTDCKPGGL
jgi:dienelactone hydrolase